jgi:hypothetical protein
MLLRNSWDLSKQRHTVLGCTASVARRVGGIIALGGFTAYELAWAEVYSLTMLLVEQEELVSPE